MKYNYYLNDIEVLIQRKKVRNINLKVDRQGKVSLSCPKNIKEEIIVEFLNSRYEWIKEAIKKLSYGLKYSDKKFEEGEKHYLFGKELTLILSKEMKDLPKFEIENDTNLIMRINPKKTIKTKEKYLQGWYKKILEEESKSFFEKWEGILKVSKKDLKIKKMRGKWGYCDFKKQIICLNTELAKRKIEFVEYVILHELCHLIAPNHGPNFKKLLNQHMPEWRSISKNE